MKIDINGNWTDIAAAAGIVSLDAQIQCVSDDIAQIYFDKAGRSDPVPP